MLLPTSSSWMRFVHVFLIAVSVSAVQAQPIVPESASAWLMFLCQASDNNATPHDTIYYQELFDTSNSDMLDSYFNH